MKEKKYKATGYLLFPVTKTIKATSQGRAVSIAYDEFIPGNLKAWMHDWPQSLIDALLDANQKGIISLSTEIKGVPTRMAIEEIMHIEEVKR